MEKKIVSYLKGNKVLSYCTSIDQQPYCATCFYVYDEENQRLIFLSDDSTRHIRESLQNEKVAGVITKDFKTIAQISGIQFTGNFINPDEELSSDFYNRYYDKFPFAKAKPSPIWAIDLHYIKMTDNTLGFGKKLIWEKEV